MKMYGSAADRFGLCITALVCFVAAPIPDALAEPASLMQHVEVAPFTQVGGTSRGVAWGDLDDDGWADVVVANALDEKAVLLWGSSDGSFVTDGECAVGALSVGDGQCVSLVDSDNDGDLDVFIAGWDGSITGFTNNGARRFERADSFGPNDLNARPSSLLWCDVDYDGDLDVFVVNRDGLDDLLLENRGDDGFAQVDGPWTGAGGEGRTGAWGDIDGDGDLDLFVGNYNAQRNVMYRNDGSLRFTKLDDHAVTRIEAYTYGATFADIDADGDADLFVTNVGHPNELHLNDGEGGFDQVAEGPLVSDNDPSKGHVLADFDLDGDIDIFIANGTEHPVYTGFANRLFLQENGEFVAAPSDEFTSRRTISAGASAADFDNDGDLDIAIANWGGAGEHNTFLRNAATNRHWVAVRLVGAESNRFGIGARVRVTTSPAGASTSQTRWMTPQTGYGSQNEPLVHFGLGDAAQIARIEIRWPSGAVDVHEHVDADRYLLAHEGGALTHDTKRQRSPFSIAPSRRPHTVRDAYPYWGADGRIVFQSNRDGAWQLYAMRPDGSDISRLTHGTGDDLTPVVSPLGDRIAFQSNRDGNPELYVMASDGAGLRRLTNHPADDQHPHWTADGRWIVFNSQRDNDEKPQVFRIDPDNGRTERVTVTGEYETYSSLDPTNSAVLTRRLVPDGAGRLDSEVVVLDPSGEIRHNISNHPRYDGWPRWSPDGRFIAFASNRTGSFRIYVATADGAELYRVSDDDSDADTQPSWSTEGDAICFTREWRGSNGERASSIGVIRLDA